MIDDSSNRSAALLAAAMSAASLVACGGNDAPADDPTLSVAELKKPETCKKCHADHYDEWSGSMHAYAAKDPVFRAMNARGQKETQGELGEFCLNCHAPMAVKDKVLSDGGANLADLDSKSEYQGVTCYYCHNVTDVQGTHNNPLVLANDATMRGGYQDPAKNTAHHGAYSTLHDSTKPDSAKLCGSCHDISVPAHFSGAPADVEIERTYQEWQTSIISKAPPPQMCGSCHFDKIQPEGGTTIANYPGVPSRPTRHAHKFQAVDTALTDFPNKDDQLAAVKAKLSTSLRVEVCAQILTGEKIRLQLENVAVGHNVPSGASQDRRLWAEIHVYDNPSGSPDHETYHSGVVPAGTAVTDLVATDPNLILYRDEGLDKDGKPADMFWQIASEKVYKGFSGADATRGTIGVAITASSLDPLFHKNRDVMYPPDVTVPAGTTHITFTLHMEPIGRDVLDDLVSGGYLDASIRDAMPTLDFLPNADVPVTLDFTFDKAAASGLSVDQFLCMETAPAPPI